MQSLTNPGADVVFDSMGGAHIWRSRNALRRGGKVVAYGLTGSLQRGRLASGRSGGRHRYRAVAVFGLYIAGSFLLPGRKRVVPYSIQTLKRLRPTLFRQDLTALFELLQQQKIKPIVAQRFPLSDARQAQELLGKGGVVGKIVLVPNGSRTFLIIVAYMIDSGADGIAPHRASVIRLQQFGNRRDILHSGVEPN